MPEPQVSIIVPSHNRRDLLAKLVDALEGQEPGTPAFELVVAADGCVDGTADWCRAQSRPFPIRVVETPGRGPAYARNRGVEQSRSPILLFLDDDVIPLPRLVRAHALAQAEMPGSAVIGPYPPWPHPSEDIFRARIRQAWMRHFSALRQPGHRFSFRDLLTGNLSLPRSLWDDLGGLDEDFAFAREDHELGVRLIARGIPIRYCDEAFAWHHEHLTSSLKRAFRRASDEGRSDALLALKHPHLRESLPVSRTAMIRRSRLSRTVLLGRKGAAAQALVSVAVPVLRMLEWLGLRRAYTRVFNAVHSLAYHRAAGKVLQGHWWKIFPEQRQANPDSRVDLAQGLEAAEEQLDRLRPGCADIAFGERLVATLPHMAGHEPWAGRHLREALLLQVAPHELVNILDGDESHPPASPPAPSSSAQGFVRTRGFGAFAWENAAQWNAARNHR